AAGQWHSCALLSGGTVECWGNNSVGQLGIGAPVQGQAVSTPTPVGTAANPLPAAATISAAAYSTCALTTAGVAYCWGQNYYGEVGDGTTNTYGYPVAMHTPSGTVTQVAAGGLGNFELVGGQAYGQGLNNYGSLGTNPDNNVLPVKLFSTN